MFFMIDLDDLCLTYINLVYVLHFSTIFKAEIIFWKNWKVLELNINYLSKYKKKIIKIIGAKVAPDEPRLAGHSFVD